MTNLKSRLLTNCFLTIILALLANTSGAVGYTPKISVDTHWTLETSVFECKLFQSVPFYGDAVFYHRSGDPIVFYLSPKHQLMQEGKASLIIEPPEWKPTLASVDLGLVDVRGTKKPVNLNERLAFRMLMGLREGMRPTFARKPWYDNSEDKVMVSLSSINFQKSFKDYNSCVAQLLPVNFDQISRSVVLYRTKKFELSRKHRQQLNNIISFVNADPSVNGFFIDGHTDEMGERRDNIELSQQRAEGIAQYFVDNGIPVDQITMRYHGERYPIAANKSQKGRARNRRVTIRLDRIDLEADESYENE